MTSAKTPKRKTSSSPPAIHRASLPAINPITHQRWTLDEATRRTLIAYCAHEIPWVADLVAHADYEAAVYQRAVGQFGDRIRRNAERVSTAAGRLRAALDERIDKWPLTMALRDKGLGKTDEEVFAEMGRALALIETIEAGAAHCATVWKRPARRADRLSHRAPLIARVWSLYPPHLRRLGKASHFTWTIMILLSAVDPLGAWCRGSDLRKRAEATHREIMRAKAYCKKHGTPHWTDR